VLACWLSTWATAHEVRERVFAAGVPIEWLSWDYPARGDSFVPPEQLWLRLVNALLWIGVCAATAAAVAGRWHKLLESRVLLATLRCSMLVSSAHAFLRFGAMFD
jgi:hypothetical protein